MIAEGYENLEAFASFVPPAVAGAPETPAAAPGIVELWVTAFEKCVFESFYSFGVIFLLGHNLQKPSHAPHEFPASCSQSWTDIDCSCVEIAQGASKKVRCLSYFGIGGFECVCVYMCV